MRKKPRELLHLCRYTTERSPLPMLAAEGLTHIVRYANPAFCGLVGKAREELLGRPFAEAVPEGEENGCIPLLDRVYCTGQAETLSEQAHTHATPDPVYWSYAVWAVLDEEDRPTGVMIQVTNSTEIAQFRRQAAAINEALLLTDVQQHEQIDVVEAGAKRLRQAMRETDHRVKNNLQTLAALLDLQIIANADTIPVAELTQIRLYIMTLAAIHDMLTQDVRDVWTINLVSGQELLQKLLPMLQGIVGTERIRWNADPIQLSIKQGIAIAVLINELVCNAIKHGSHKIDLNLLTSPDSNLVLEVCDDGPGFPEGFDPHANGNFGMELIESVSRHDLQGTTTYTNRSEGGARIVVVFPLPVLTDEVSAN